MRIATILVSVALLACAGCQTSPTRCEPPSEVSTRPLVKPLGATTHGIGKAAPPEVILASHQRPDLTSGPPPVTESLPTPHALRFASGPQAISATLEELEALALASNPAMGEAVARIQAARGQWIQAGLPPNPTAGYSASEIGNEGRAGQQGVFIGQEIVTAGKLRLNRAVAWREIQIADRQLDAMRRRVLTDVRMSFYEVLIAQRRLELAESLAETGRNSVVATQSLLDRKDVSQTELLQAKVEADTTEILVDNARLAHVGAWQRLAAVVGQPEMPLRKVVGDPTRLSPPVEQAEAMNQIRAESPELAAAHIRVERARWAYARARAQASPNLDLQGTAQFDDSSNYVVAGAQIGMPIPFVNRNQGGIQQARAEVVAAEQAVARLDLALQKRLASVYQRYATAAQQAQRYSRDIVPNVRQALENTTEGYRAGEFSFLQQLTAQRTYFQTNLAYLDALEQYWASSRELEGLLLSESLEAAMQ